MNILSLRSAVNEIKQACDVPNKTRSPFFFVVGAGISFPMVPTASQMIEQCKQKAAEYGRVTENDSISVAEDYSHWFEKAYPQPIQRQQYLRTLIENVSISHANFRLAHLLLNQCVTNLVITPNFDDLLSRALTLFGQPHLVCESPAEVERID